MSKASNVKGRYFRAGIAIANEKKPIFDERLSKLGLKTTGDLVSMFIHCEGIVEALKPFAKEYLETRAYKPPGKADILKELKAMDPKELAELMKAIQAQQAAAQA